MSKVDSALDAPRTDLSPEAKKALRRQEAQRRWSVLKLLGLRLKARDEIDRLIHFLDASDDYVMTEPEDDDDRELVGDEEPSLGSFDQMANQEKSWKQRDVTCDVDAELDTADDDPGLGFLERHPSVLRPRGSQPVRQPGNDWRWSRE
jgi:hypothetical protein